MRLISFVIAAIALLLASPFTAFAAVNQADNIGDQKTAVILVSFTDSMAVTQSSSIYAQAHFTATNSINAFITEYSYGKTTLSGDVFGWYTVAAATSCSESNVVTQAIAAADPYVDFTQYKRIVIVMPQTDPLCYFSAGTGTIGTTSISTADGTIDASYILVIWEGYVNLSNSMAASTIQHEFLHSFGIWHADGLDCGASIVSNSPTSCTFRSYGDPFSIAGSLRYATHPNAAHKQIIGWLSSSQIQDVTASGTYTIYPIGTGTANVKSLHITLGTPIGYYIQGDSTLHYITDYYIDYQTAYGVDANLANKGVDTNGVLVYGLSAVASSRGTMYRTLLLDMTPGSIASETSNPNDMVDSFLLVGNTFTEPYNNLTITVVGTTSDGGMQVTVSAPSFVTSTSTASDAVEVPLIDGPGALLLSLALLLAGLYALRRQAV